MTLLFEFARQFFYIFNEMALYLLLGFTIAGLLQLFFNDTFISRKLGTKGWRSNTLAALFGVPLPLCSCGVVPTGIALFRRGASRGSTVSFLTSTPQTGVDSILVTAAMLGYPLALWKVLAALVTGLSGGFIVDHLTPTQSQSQQQTDAQKPIRNFRAFFEYSYVELVASLRNYLLLGLIMAALLATAIPDNAIMNIGLDQHPILLYAGMLIISIPMYVCATASVPIAMVLIAKGFPVGAAIVFLMGGPATNVATITVLWKELGSKTAIIYLVNIVAGSILFGFSFDLLFPAIATVTPSAHVHSPSSYQLVGSIVFALLLCYSYLTPFWMRKTKQQATTTILLDITGITCNGCVMAIKNKLFRLPYVVNIDLDTSGKARIEVADKNSSTDIESEIRQLGYQVQGSSDG